MWGPELGPPKPRKKLLSVTHTYSNGQMGSQEKQIPGGLQVRLWPACERLLSQKVEGTKWGTTFTQLKGISPCFESAQLSLTFSSAHTLLHSVSMPRRHSIESSLALLCFGSMAFFLVAILYRFCFVFLLFSLHTNSSNISVNYGSLVLLQNRLADLMSSV